MAWALQKNGLHLYRQTNYTKITGVALPANLGVAGSLGCQIPWGSEGHTRGIMSVRLDARAGAGSYTFQVMPIDSDGNSIPSGFGVLLPITPPLASIALQQTNLAIAWDDGLLPGNWYLDDGTNRTFGGLLPNPVWPRNAAMLNFAIANTAGAAVLVESMEFVLRN